MYVWRSNSLNKNTNRTQHKSALDLLASSAKECCLVKNWDWISQLVANQVLSQKLNLAFPYYSVKLSYIMYSGILLQKQISLFI